MTQQTHKVAELVALRDQAQASIDAMGSSDLKGTISDGFHSFDELYDHRMTLFAVVLKAHRANAWKSRLHADGDMWDGWFIVGINTPEGQFTYHYKAEHWDLFDVPELDHAPEWDGHMPSDIIRLMSL